MASKASFSSSSDDCRALWFEAGGSGGSGRHAAPDVTNEVASGDFLAIMDASANVEELFADLQGITCHGDYVKKTFSTERDFRSTSMADFIASLDAPVGSSLDGQPPAYMGNNIVPAQLLEHIRYPSYFDPRQYIPPRIWIGPKGTLTPLHRDDSDNLFAQVWSEKASTSLSVNFWVQSGRGWPHSSLPDANLVAAAAD